MTSKMTSSNRALKIILDQTQKFDIEKVDFNHSLGRTLKEDILADRDFPPFDRVSMDGIALAAETFNKGQRTFKIEGVQAAGSEQRSLANSDNCMEAMTGAVLPKNTDVVIQYELLDIQNGIVNVNTESIKDFQNIHKKGLDRKQGDVLIEKDTVISAAEIGVLTTVGKSEVTVAKQPKVMIISTGNELVEVDQMPKEYQIRRSNVYTLVSLLKRLNINAGTSHILDDKESLKAKIGSYLKEYDVLLFSGAVSKGKFDFIPEVLDELGVDKLFHRVSQRPGKPFWFGKKQNKTIFAFPGNPVSTFVSCMKYFYPWFHKSLGVNYVHDNLAVLSEDFTFKPDLTYFLQVKIENRKGTIYATPVKGKGSGDLANLVDADGFLELPADLTNFKKGDVLPYMSYRGFEL
jgi:molybdopterin molybdotransferase